MDVRVKLGAFLLVGQLGILLTSCIEQLRKRGGVVGGQFPAVHELLLTEAYVLTGVPLLAAAMVGKCGVL